MTPSSANYVKIRFDLTPNEDGYPPIDMEMLNATELGGNVCHIENAPFFVENISYGDKVLVSPTDVEGTYKFEEVVEQSSFTSLSIVIMDSSMDTFLMDLLRGMDCVIEYGEFGAWRVLAVAVPSSTDYGALSEQLQSLEDRELISFAELAISS